MTHPSRIAIVWFRRDLRLADNPALTAALQSCDCILPVYIHAPEEEAPWKPGSASNWWLHNSLSALCDSISQTGSRLIITHGPTKEKLIEIAATTGATHLYWNRLYDPVTIERDSQIKRELHDLGIDCQSFNSNLLIEPVNVLNRQGSPYKVFTAFWRTARGMLDGIGSPLPAATQIPTPPKTVPPATLESLNLLPQNNWHEKLAAIWKPGEAGGHEQWAHFLYNNLPYYDSQRDFPAEESTTSLSPHLHFGEITPRQLFWSLQHQADQAPGIGQHLDRLSAQLGWREFAHYTLFHFPHSATESLDSRFASNIWHNGRDNRELLERWQRGETGIPIVDAGMRQLWQTGWMHNRVRMIVASLLTKNLGIHWLEGARWFWDTLVDADLANNTLGWQWTAGCGVDAAPYFRVFNPARQAERFDPAGRYIRTWLPELATADNRILMNGRHAADNGIDYPPPMLDLQKTRKQALERWELIKRNPKNPASNKSV
mgnify:CR=1 FL=1